MMLAPHTQSGLLPIPPAKSSSKPFQLLKYFTSASLIVILLAFLASGYAGGWLIYGAFLESEKEESENIADAFADLAESSGFTAEMWGKARFSTSLKNKLTEMMDDFGVEQFTLFDKQGQLLENITLAEHTRIQAAEEYDPESFSIAKSGGKTISWYSRVWTPLLPFVRSQGVTETYSAIRNGPKGEILAIARVNRNLAPVLEQVRSTLLSLMTGVGLVCLLIFFSLWLLVRKADRILKQQREVLEDHDRRKDEFLAVCSHDVRSPLTSALAGTKVLLSERKAPLTELQREVLQENQKSLRTVLDLVNTILDMARLEAGAEELHLEELDLNQTIRDATMLLRGLMETHKTELDLQLPAEAVKITGDRLKVIRMVSNIASNAIKHAGGKAVKIQLIPNAESVTISVVDQGPGIKKEDLERLFDKFSALARKKKTREEGTGLGLSIVHKLATLHGGNVQVQSEWGKGTTFQLNLPRQPRNSTV